MVKNHLPREARELFDEMSADALHRKSHDEESHELLGRSPGYVSFVFSIPSERLDLVESFAGWLLSGGGSASQYFTWSKSDFESEWNSYLENNLEIL
jgi:hypothetical protein